MDDVAGCFDYYADAIEALDRAQAPAAGGGGVAAGAGGVPLPLPDDRFKCRVRKEPLGVVSGGGEALSEEGCLKSCPYSRLRGVPPYV